MSEYSVFWTQFIIVSICVIFIVIILFLINIEATKEYRNRCYEINEGDCLLHFIYDENPYHRHLFISKVIEIREGHIRYKYKDGSGGSISIDDCIHYDRKRPWSEIENYRKYFTSSNMDAFYEEYNLLNQKIKSCSGL